MSSTLFDPFSSTNSFELTAGDLRCLDVPSLHWGKTGDLIRSLLLSCIHPESLRNWQSLGGEVRPLCMDHRYDSVCSTQRLCADGKVASVLSCRMLAV